MSALPFRVFDECVSEPAKPWIIKGVIAAGEDSTWFGPPGALKSALLTDLAVAVATGRDWRGFRTKQQLGVVLFCLERAGLTRRRLAAYAKRDGLTGLPIAVCDALVDMVDPLCVDSIVGTAQATAERFGISVGLVVVDTYSKAIAAGGGNENDAQHANIIGANLKRIHEVLANPVHIATIGHSGKDESRGERGSNARLGHVDLAVQISGDTVKTATVTKANDQIEGPLTTFSAETVGLGMDEDNEPLAVGILSAATPLVSPSPQKMSDRQALALATLDQTPRDEQGRVTLDAWRDSLFSRGVLDRGAKNPRSAFKKIKDGLAAANLISECDGLISRRQLPGRGFSFPNFPTSISPPPPLGQPTFVSPPPPMPGAAN